MNVANAITMFRIAGTIALVGLKPFSGAFFTVYALCGISDVLDGFVARKTNTVSEFGSKLDSVADMVFYMVMLCKILPSVYGILPLAVWICAFAVFVVKMVLYIFYAVKRGAFMSNHTILNKITGFCVFLLPYMFIWPDIAVEFCKLTCIISLIASYDEFVHKVIK